MTGVERLALDIKIISSPGVGHYADTSDGSLVAASEYRDAASARDNVRAKCVEKGVLYEPLLFTAQGGCEKHTEAMISQIADNVAQAACRDKGKVKAEMLETIAMSIARSVAKAVMRRQPKSPQAHSNSASSTFLFESAIFEEPIEDDLVALSSSPALLPRVLIFPGVYTLSVPQQKVHKHWGIVTPRLPCCSTCGPWRPPWPPSLGLLRLLRPRPSLAALPPSQPCLSRPRPWHALRGWCGCGRLTSAPPVLGRARRAAAL